MAKKIIKIGIAGYGDFGSRLVPWLKANAPDIEILFIIEPNRHKRDLIKKQNIIAFSEIYDLSAELIDKTDVLIDCSPRGCGKLNKEIYEKLGISAIFQNGEEKLPTEIIYYPGKVINKKSPIYLKIPLCSGIAALKLLSELKKNNITLPIDIFGYHCKVSNTARNLTFNYTQSNEEIWHLFKVRAIMNVVYLRGEPYKSNFVYYGSLSMRFRKSPNLKLIKSILCKKSELIDHEPQDLDTLHHNPTHKTVIINDAIVQKANTIHIPTISYTPEVNFPLNLMAARLVAGAKSRLKQKRTSEARSNYL